MKNLIFILAAIVIGFSSCKKSDETAVYSPATDGITGEWYSSKTNVAVLLSYYFKVDSIYANFNANNTYHVESFLTRCKNYLRRNICTNKTCNRHYLDYYFKSEYTYSGYQRRHF